MLVFWDFIGKWRTSLGPVFKAIDMGVPKIWFTVKVVILLSPKLITFNQIHFSCPVPPKKNLITPLIRAYLKNTLNFNLKR